MMTLAWPERRFAFFCAVVLLVGIPINAPRALGLDHLASLRVTFELKDSPINEAIAELDEQSGVSIRTIGPVGSHRVSVVLQETTLLEGLNRILSNLNYAAVWTGEELLIYLSGPRGNQNLINNRLSALPRNDHARIGTSKEDQKTLHQGNAEAQGAPPPDLTYYMPSHDHSVPMDAPLVPPSSVDGEIITRTDLKISLENWEKVLPENLELVPPIGDNDTGMTFEEHIAASLRTSLENSPGIQIVPSD